MVADDALLKTAAQFTDDWTSGRAAQNTKPKPAAPKGPVTASVQIEDDFDAGIYVKKSMKVECTGEIAKLVVDDKEYTADLVYSFADDHNANLPSRTFVALSTKDGSVEVATMSMNKMDPKDVLFNGVMIASSLRPYMPQGELAPIVVPSFEKVYMFLLSKADATSPTPSGFAMTGIKVNLAAPDNLIVAKFIVQP
jgi:hypothetical protein